jgi:hypothetical protein
VTGLRRNNTRIKQVKHKSTQTLKSILGMWIPIAFRKATAMLPHRFNSLG